MYTPDSPSCPRIVSVTGLSVYLEWTAPEYDGGSAITGYVLIYGAPDALRVLYSRETITDQITNCTLICLRLLASIDFSYKFALSYTS